ncbi:nucleotidyltransferase domain-containing protein [bacterium]|nr:nucleotidyltransferase domain-containing protein [bacterium]
MSRQASGNHPLRFQAAVAELCRRYSVRRLELLGSAASGRFAEISDDDFLVEFLPLPEGKRADAYSGLLEDLRALLERRVDLVVESAIRNQVFREAIAEERTLVYGRQDSQTAPLCRAAELRCD